MKSMKLTPQEQKDMTICCPADAPKVEYPYGLRIHLDDNSLKALGIEALPPVGSVLSMVAKVEVVRRSQSEGEEGEHQDLGLQITDMELNGDGIEKLSKAKKFYRTAAGVERDSKKMIPIEGPE